MLQQPSYLEPPDLCVQSDLQSLSYVNYCLTAQKHNCSLGTPPPRATESLHTQATRRWPRVSCMLMLLSAVLLQSVEKQRRMCTSSAFVFTWKLLSLGRCEGVEIQKLGIICNPSDLALPHMYNKHPRKLLTFTESAMSQINPKNA